MSAKNGRMDENETELFLLNSDYELSDIEDNEITHSYEHGSVNS